MDELNKVRRENGNLTWEGPRARKPTEEEMRRNVERFFADFDQWAAESRAAAEEG